METTQPYPQPQLDEPPAPSAPTLPPAAPPESPLPEPRGCLYALSQPPLMLFLTVIAALLGLTSVHDLLL
ncbi:hypothetical protein E0L36_07665 [Streptomyces sp. AJS327]|nr:hypothetical protein [Streptomyces sp. AJS327]MBA0050773.1 hypothetical protein [Streptomyces sp. AJS327]